RDRARDEVGVGDRREPDEMHGSLERRVGGDLEREPTLACAPGPGDGDEPRSLDADLALDAPQCVLATGEAMKECGKARGREGVERRKVSAKIGGDELEALDGGRVVFPPVASE